MVVTVQRRFLSVVINMEISLYLPNIENASLENQVTSPFRLSEKWSLVHLFILVAEIHRNCC